MEHRWKKRCRLSLDATVRGHDNLTLHGRSRDISPDGMFIQLTQRAVSTNTIVEIELPHGGCCLHGWVVHAGDEGIGVLFHSLNDEDKLFLGRLLSEDSTT